MSLTPNAVEFVEQLAAVWPPARWRDVHVVVAVSGGADSMAALRGLLDVKRAAGGNGRIYAAHVNHQLRGDASDADENWLRQQCELLGAPLLVEHTDVTALAAERGDGIEEAARDSRYRLLTAAAESVGARFVATGHTRDDQVETILFRVLRGTGLQGLAGIPVTRVLSPGVAAVRPMLSVRRREVLRYLEAIGQAFRDDASNEESRFVRNRVRNELLPMLRERFHTEVDASLWRLGELAAEAQAIIDDAAIELLAQCRKEATRLHDGAHECVLATAPLANAREYLVSEVLRRAWREAGFPEQGMTRAWWQQLAQFAQSAGRDVVLTLPGNVRASRPVSGVLALCAAVLP